MRDKDNEFSVNMVATSVEKLPADRFYIPNFEIISQSLGYRKRSRPKNMLSVDNG